MSRERDPRDVDVHEIVEVLEQLGALSPMAWDTNSPVYRAHKIIDKLVGPEREAEARWSSRHIVADEFYCQRVAESLAISTEEAIDYFIGEPIRRVDKVAAWALETADRNFAGLDKNYEPDPETPGPRVHGQRGRAVADMLRDWAIQNQTGVYRTRQQHRQATPEEISA